MTIRRGIVKIFERAAGGFSIQVGQFGWVEGDSDFLYRIEFTGTNPTNVAMDEDLGEWPPQVSGAGRLFVEGEAQEFRSDQFELDDLTYLRSTLLGIGDINVSDELELQYQFEGEAVSDRGIGTDVEWSLATGIRVIQGGDGGEPPPEDGGEFPTGVVMALAVGGALLLGLALRR